MTAQYLMMAEAAAGTGGGILPMIVTFVPMILILYFLIIRPQQKKQKDHAQMVSRLKKGNRVITSGGLHGTVIGTKNDIVVLKIAENVKVECQSSAVSHVVEDSK